MSVIRKEDEQAYRSLGMEPVFLEVPDAGQLRRTIAEAARMRADALIVRADPIFASNRDQIASLALQHALPTMAEGKVFVLAGCLASYSSSYPSLLRPMAVFVDKILKGAKPADLPIEQPTKFELVINLSTATALRISIPQSLALRGDELIQ